MSGDANGRDELLRQFEAAICGMELADLRQLAGDILLLGGRVPPPAPPDRPRLWLPPRAQLAIYRLCRRRTHPAWPARSSR